MFEHPSLVGRAIAGRYRIEAAVGSGAMGDVYRATHVELGTDVAVKIMRPSIAKDASFKERFYREARAASSLEHRNSVRVIDFGTDGDGLVYIVMEYLRGRDLLALLRQEPPLPDERIVDILAQTLAAISTAHHRGIVHRDLKPENIMIVADDDGDQRDVVKVCDFGIAKLVDARSFKSDELAPTALTTGGAVIGTPEYMSPEQARGESLDSRSDLYSVGVILYRMLTGRLPFEAENAIGIAVKHVMERPIAPSSFAPNVNRKLEAICLKALEKDPSDRHATAKEMRAELKAALGAAPNRVASSSDASLPVATLPQGPVGAESAPTVREGAVAPPTQYDVASARLNFDPDRRILATVLGVAAALGASAIAYALFARDSSPESVPTGLVSSSMPVEQNDDRLAKSLTISNPAIETVSSDGAPGAPGASGSGVQGASAARILAGPPLGATSAVRPAAPLPSASSSPVGSLASVVGGAASVPAASPLPVSTGGDPATQYRPSNALVSFQVLSVDRVQHDAVQRRIAELAPRLNECYRDALFMAGHAVGGIVTVDMSIDATGHVVGVVSAPQLPAFQRCAGRVVSSLSIPASAVESGGGTASQTLRLTP